MKCLECQSERLVHDAKAVDYFEMAMKRPLKLELDLNPAAWLDLPRSGIAKLLPLA